MAVRFEGIRIEHGRVTITHGDPPLSPPEVAVLGTGPSGLAAAKALLEHGLRPVVFEAAANAGGMWEGPGRGAWSDFARTNISRYSCVFSDLDWPADSEVFPIRRDLARYLRHYADTFDLSRHVRFGTTVNGVCPVEGERMLAACRLARRTNGQAVRPCSTTW